METIIDATKQMDLDTAIRSLDEMFYGWLGSARCDDQVLTSAKEREQIGFYYRKIRELLTRCN